jgi:hypothetical protein
MSNLIELRTKCPMQSYKLIKTKIFKDCSSFDSFYQLSSIY